MVNEEKHQKHFRGCWCRAELFELLESGTILPREVILLMVIDSLVNVKGDDCYASNEYLGNMIGTSERNVRNMIEHLRKLRLVRRTSFNGRRRTLVTSWSRVPQPIPSDRNSSSGQTGTLVPGRPEPGFRPINSTRDSTSKSESLSPHPGAEGDSKPDSKRLHPRWARFASILGSAIQSVRKVNLHSKLNSWAQAISRIHTVDGIPIPRIQAVVQWYAAQIQKGDLIRNNSAYLPVAYSGDAFRSKFLRIEDAITRQRADKKRRENAGEEGPRVKIRVIRDEAS